MCGIVGLFAKATHVEERLGEHVADMLEQLGDRGPDSAGVAVYRDAAPAGHAKLCLHGAGTAPDWAAIGRSLGAEPQRRGSEALFVVEGEPAEAVARLRAAHPELRVVSAGESIELYKSVGDPHAFVEEFGLRELHGSHALGHTRMATESAVTTDGSHPFSTGDDLCLVHNGSLSNHNRLRLELRRAGMEFQTLNDTEVAAGYLTWRMREGASLSEALEGCLDDLDGFYTFAVGTRDGFAVLRDPIACKPAVMAETEDWVAMASEWRAIAVLPGAADAEAWEPAPARVYSWEREPVA
jgi:methylamine---glutamate N-methyltransferase subunit A